MKDYLFIALFIVCWSCEDVVEKSTNPRPLPSFSVALNISDNDEARSVLHTIDGGYIILVSEVIDWPSYSIDPIRGSSFLVKTDSLGVQEWVTELDNSLAEDLYLMHDNKYFYLEQDIDGSYIVRTSFSSPGYNCFIIDANGNNQTISYKGY